MQKINIDKDYAKSFLLLNMLEQTWRKTNRKIPKMQEITCLSRRRE